MKNERVGTVRGHYVGALHMLTHSILLFPSIVLLSGDTLWNCPSQTTTPPSHPLPVTVSMTVSVCHTLRHALRHTLCLSHFPLHHPAPPTLSVHFTFPHTVGNSISVECLYLHDHLHHFPWPSPSLSVTNSVMDLGMYFIIPLFSLYHCSFTYSGSKNCSSVCLFLKDCIVIGWWCNPQPWNFHSKKYNILALKWALYHVTHIKNHEVID